MILPNITGATAPTGPFCKTFRYCYTALRDSRSVAFCARTDLVDGSGNNAITCNDERHAVGESNCGEPGKFWEAM